MKDLCRQKWKVKLISRGACGLPGTGIAGKNHRTIKRMTARSGGVYPLETDLYWPWPPAFTTDLPPLLSWTAQ